MIGYRLRVARRFVQLAAACTIALAGCTARTGQAPVTLQFRNVRTFVGPGGGAGESEWDILGGIARRFHVENNRFGIEFEQTRRDTTSAPPGEKLHDYTVRMVVSDLGQIGEIDRQVRAAAERRLGSTGQHAQFVLSDVAMVFHGTYVSASIEIKVFGRVDPGSHVYVYEHGSRQPLQAEVAASGSWTVSVRVQDGAAYIYGYAANPRSPRLRKCFRVNIYTRRHEPVASDEFDRLRSAEP